MRAFGIWVVTLMVGHLTFAQNAFVAANPTISIDRFHVGQEWIWDYSEASGAPYSSERYRVIEIQGSKITFEMASTYGHPPGDPIPETPHHRMTADLSRCLKAHKNAVDPQPWSIDLEYWDSKTSQWISAGFTHPLAFEEKFNCNPHAQFTQWQYASELDQKQGASAFRTRRKNGNDASWFEINGTNAAVAVEKEFHQQGQLTYRFVRRPEF